MPLSETGIFQKISLTATAKMMTSSNICRHFEFFFNETKDNMLVIMHAKFEVNSCCSWDFRHKRYLRHSMHPKNVKN